MRTRRRFTAEFKATAVAWLASRPVADVARICDVSVSVLHRWRRKLGEHSVTPAERRRRFTKTFKAAAVERLESGESIAKVAAALEVRPNTLHRWRKEGRDFGGQAFSGYGKSRTASQPARVIKITFLCDEYQRIRDAFENSLARSLPDFARARLVEPEEHSRDVADAIQQIEGKLEDLIEILRSILWSSAAAEGDLLRGAGAQRAGYSR